MNLATGSNATPRVVVMTTMPEDGNYQSWTSHCPFPLCYLTPAEVQATAPESIALLVTLDQYHEPERAALLSALARNIPTLILADGILKHQNIWEHPQLPAGAIFQPVLGHKISTIGASQDRWLESWGNIGKCETVGLPRLDRYLGPMHRERKRGMPSRILIATASTPYYTEEQRTHLTAALLDLKAFFDALPVLGGIPIEPQWRITSRLGKVIGIDSAAWEISGEQMAAILETVDAVITTPSATVLEGMLAGLPVALLDYCNLPDYVPTAWKISAPGHIADVVSQLVDPPGAKMLFQHTTLHDSLACASPATPRLIELITKLVECTQPQRARQEPIRLPNRLLNQEPMADCGQANLRRVADIHHLGQCPKPILTFMGPPPSRNLPPPQSGIQTVSFDPLCAEAPNDNPWLPQNCESGRMGQQEESGTNQRRWSHSLIEHIHNAQQLLGSTDQMAIWEVTVNSHNDRALFMHPPARTLFTMADGTEGCFKFAVMIHPDAWEKSGDGCGFDITVDGCLALSLESDPHHRPGDRRWNEFTLGIPENPLGRHEIMLETRGLGGSVEFRWALWRDLCFTASTPIQSVNLERSACEQSEC